MPDPNNEANGVSADLPVEPDSALIAERDKLAAAAVDLNDRLLRRTAEFDNFRKRTEKERAEFYEYAAMDAVRALLPILDDFERALKTETNDKEYARGMELIFQRTFESLKKLGLEPIDAEGKTFDPQTHHAVEMTATDDVPPNMVLADLQRGYNFKGRLLRPTMVKVSVAGSGN